MTAAPADSLTLAHASLMIREALKDRSFEATPLGSYVTRYIHWKRSEWGATDTTVRDYEAILARTALFFADLELVAFTPPDGADLLRECWDYHWGDRMARTRSKVRSVWVDFFDWAIRERHITGNPARSLSAPKKRGVRRDPFSEEFCATVIARQQYGADQLGVRLILRYALRRAELILVRYGDFDFERERLTVMGKGGKVRLIPIPDDAFWGDLLRFGLEIGASSETYLLYRTDVRKVLCRKDEATESEDLRNGRIAYYRWRTRRDHSRPVSGKTAHQWWYRCLERAGITDAKGMHMHRGRHTVATEILRKTGNIVAAQKLLGHESVETTTRSYALYDDSDVEQVLRSIREVEA